MSTIQNTQLLEQLQEHMLEAFHDKDIQKMNLLRKAGIALGFCTNDKGLCDEEQCYCVREQVSAL